MQLPSEIHYAVRDELVKIESSRLFNSTPKLRQILRFITEETLSERGSELNTHLIAHRVFRGSGEAMVRSEFGRLKATLRKYYESEGRRDRVRIAIQTGSYIPEFYIRDPVSLRHESLQYFNRAFRSEALLRDAVASLLSRLPGISGVEIVHGTVEHGRDIVFFQAGGLGERLLCACIVKNSPIRAALSGSESFRAVLNQAEQALRVPYLVESGPALHCSLVYIITPFDISSNAAHAISTELQERSGQVVLIGREQLVDLFRAYWPDYLSLDDPDLAERNETRRTRLFITYSHKDIEHYADFTTHLQLLKSDGVIAGWTNREIKDNTKEALKISKDLESAEVAIFLISPDFLASKYCFGTEVQRAIQRHQRGDLLLVPVIVRASDWRRAPFGRLAPLPVDGRSVSSWRDRDLAWRSVIDGIAGAIRGRRQVRRAKDTLSIRSL